MTQDRGKLPRGAPPSWLPNWRNEGEYPDEECSPKLWAWQFLRRNPDYQDDYCRWRQFVDFFSLESQHCRDLEAQLTEKWNISHLWDPAAAGNVWIGAWGSKADALPPHFFEFEGETEVPDDDPMRFEAGGGGRRVILRGDPSEPETDPAMHYFVRVDARYPLNKQIEAIAEFHQARQQGLKEYDPHELINPKGPQLAKLREGLRVFDAAWCGAQPKEIAAALFPSLSFNPSKGDNKHLVARPLKRAKDLVSGRYRELLFT